LAPVAVEGHHRVRRDRVDKTGTVTLRYRSRLLHIGIGRAHTGTRVLLLVNDLDVRVITADGELLRQLTPSTRRRTINPMGDPRIVRDVSRQLPRDVSRHNRSAPGGS
jgi:hypothetical protein